MHILTRFFRLALPLIALGLAASAAIRLKPGWWHPERLSPATASRSPDNGNDTSRYGERRFHLARLDCLRLQHIT